MAKLSIKDALIADLKPYTDNPRVLLLPEDVTSKMKVPEEWVTLLQQQQAGESKPWVNLWQDFASALPATLTFLRNRVFCVAILLEDDRPPSLIYVYKSDGGYEFYRGGMPLKNTIPEHLADVWQTFPATLRRLYEIHDGWVYLPSDALGPLPTEEIISMTAEDLDLDDKDLKKLPFQIEKVYPVFSSGGGDYIWLDTGHADMDGEASALIWLHEKPTQPKVNIDFWSTLNGWMEIGFKDDE